MTRRTKNFLYDAASAVLIGITFAALFFYGFAA